MTTALVFAQQIRRRIQAVSAVGPTTTITDDLDETATSVPVAADVGEGDLPALIDGAVIEIDAEQMFVTGLSGTGTVEVIRGYQGSTAATHASGATVWVAQPLAVAAILEHMAAEIRSWPEDLYTTDSITVSWPARTATVDLGTDEGTDVRRLLDVRRFGSAASARARTPDVELITVAPDTDFPSGFALQLRATHFLFRGAVDLRVVYATGFDLSDFDADSDLQDDVHLSESLLDLLAFGVGVRLLTELASYRAELDRQGQHRNASEVTHDTIATAIGAWQGLYERRKGDEIRRLQTVWGVRA